MTDDIIRTEPTEPPQHLPKWVRQLIWFVALWCLGISMLGAISLAIRLVLFA